MNHAFPRPSAPGNFQAAPTNFPLIKASSKQQPAQFNIHAHVGLTIPEHSPLTGKANGWMRGERACSVCSKGTIVRISRYTPTRSLNPHVGLNYAKIVRFSKYGAPLQASLFHGSQSKANHRRGRVNLIMASGQIHNQANSCVGLIPTSHCA